MPLLSMFKALPAVAAAGALAAVSGAGYLLTQQQQVGGLGIWVGGQGPSCKRVVGIVRWDRDDDGYKGTGGSHCGGRGRGPGGWVGLEGC